MPQPVIRCDLSRAFLDLCALPSGQTLRIPNIPDAITAWVAEIEGTPSSSSRPHATVTAISLPP